MQTRRLTLRPVAAEDEPFVHAMYADERVGRHLGRVPWPFTRDDARRMTLRMSAEGHTDRERYLVAARREDGEPCGILALRELTPIRAVLGFSIAPAWWGRGYATEAAGVLVSEAFRAGFLEVQASPRRGHETSRSVLLKLGFSVEAEGIQEQTPYRGIHTVDRWALHRDSRMEPTR